jgi:hypothetical protein
MEEESYMAEKTEDPSARRPMAPQPAKGDERDQAPHPDDHNHPDGEGRDVPPADRPRNPKSPWLGGG